MTFSRQPSKLLGLETPWGAWQLDETVMWFGRRIENSLAEGKKLEELLSEKLAPNEGQYSSGSAMVKRKTKVRKDGTW